MFKSHWWSSVIRSDEGFTVKFLSRNYLRYTEGELCLEAFYEEARGSADLGQSFDCCETGLTVDLELKENERILGNILRALESKGWRATVIGEH